MGREATSQLQYRYKKHSRLHLRLKLSWLKPKRKQARSRYRGLATIKVARILYREDDGVELGKTENRATDHADRGHDEKLKVVRSWENHEGGLRQKPKRTAVSEKMIKSNDYQYLIVLGSQQVWKFWFRL